MGLLDASQGRDHAPYYSFVLTVIGGAVSYNNYNKYFLLRVTY